MMEFKLVLIYFLISASFVIQETKTENDEVVLQRVKRLDVDAERDPSRVLMLQESGDKEIRDRRSAENDELSLQRVKRLDVDLEGDSSRVVSQHGNDHKAIRDRRSTENDESVPEDAEDLPYADDVSREDDTSAEDTFKKSLHGSNFGQNTDDPTDVLKLSLSEFNSDESDAIEEPIRKHVDKHFMKIKQKWKTAMRKRKQHKYQLKKKMTKRFKHKEAKDIAQLKSNRRRYHRQIKTL